MRGTNENMRFETFYYVVPGQTSEMCIEYTCKGFTELAPECSLVVTVVIVGVFLFLFVVIPVEFAEISDPCKPNPCRNHGTCVPASDQHGYHCICPGKFLQPDCEHGKEECPAQVKVFLSLSLPRVINFEFPLQRHQKYHITQYGELGFSLLTQTKYDYAINSYYLTYTFLFKRLG